MSNREIDYVKLLTENSSFQLVRTNPKLTGNIKITINDAGDMWLESIKANTELSKDLYSKVPIDLKQSHPANIFRFLNGGSTPNEIVFDLKEQVDSTKTSKNFKDQYDFSHYFSGAKYLASNKYTERMSYFAPLYLKEEVPDYFVIFKIEDPANFPLDQVKAKYEAGETKTDYLIDLFNKASIIKTFDLRAETSPGKYIRAYIKSPNFPASPLTVSYGENEFTTWNGILLNEGKFGNRGELLNTLYSSSQPLKFFEENITNGFSRNGVIFPNILNLEFVFNDESSKKYDFNRYLGMYVNAIELTQLEIDLDRAYSTRSTWENTPRFRKKFLESDEVILNQTNSDGVIIPFKDSIVNFSEFKDSFKDSQNLFINYLSDKDSNLYMPKLAQPFEIDYGTINTCSLSSSGTTITANLTSHGYKTGEVIIISSIDFEYSGEFLITTIDNDNFTYIVDLVPSNPTAIGTCKNELSTGKFRFANNQIDLGLFFGQSQPNFLQDIGFTTKTAGHSHAVIKINSELNNYDEIKIYHPGGTQLDSNGKYDLIISTQGYSLIPNPGEYYIYNDYDNVLGYDEFYMNGSGVPDQIASALANCINGIRRKTFTAYAYNDRVFIKLNPAGDFDNSHKISFSSPTIDYSVITLNSTITGAQLNGALTQFIGGSKEIGNRLIIDSGHLDKINQNINSILVKSSNSWSKIRKVSPWVDEVTETNSATSALRLEILSNYDNKIAIVLDEDETPTISNKEFLMKLKFKPSFGLLSFYLIKDLDLDFYSSTYTNFPNIDLYQYYFIPAEVNLLQTGIDYAVYNGDILYFSNKGTNYLTLSNVSTTGGSGTGLTLNIFADDFGQLKYVKISNPGTGYSNGDTITINSGNDDATLILIKAGNTFTALINTAYSIINGNPLVIYDPASTSIASSILDENGELKKFEGFSILKDPSKIVQPENSLEYSLKTKYLNGFTDSEYDFYKENESLDFSLRSKMIPYITKWGIKNGKDSRDNPYRLNTEIIFGRNNFSPDHQDYSQNPLNFTHEWFYIESKFNYINDESILAQNNNYFDVKFDKSKLLSDPEYFINYFTYTPTTNDGKEIGDTQFRYSSLYKNAAGQYEAFFKGFRLLFKDVTDPTVIGIDNKPIAKDITSRFDGYKFSCILRPLEEDINDLTKPPIQYEIIEHTDWKFIVVVINVYIGSINSIDTYWLDSLSPNTPIDNSNFDTAMPVSDLYYNSINGDYRISFDLDSISNVTHTLLYSLKNKKYNNRFNSFSTIKMGSKLNFTSTGYSSSSNTVKALPNILTPTYIGSLADDLIKPSDSTLIFIKDLGTGLDIFFNQFNGFVPNSTVTNPFTSALEKFLQHSASYNIGLVTISPLTIYGIVPTGTTSIINQNYIFKIMAGGENYFEKLFSKISFANFKKYINSQDKIIEYSSYSLNQSGISVNVTSPNFYLEIPDSKYVEKDSQIITNPTVSVPIQFSGQGEIGTDYEVADLPVKYELNRYSGEFEPVVQTYSIFQSNYSFKKNLINDLSLSNTKINSNVDKLMTIQNFSHIKVADSQILVLESDDSYLPKYPKINEVSIGRENYFLLKGNWDWGFHHKYSSKNTYSPVSGALRVEEDDSFLAKLINLPETIELTDFILRTPSLKPSEDFNVVDLSTIEIITKETPSSLEGIINVNNVLTRFLIEDGIIAKFNEYLINSNQYIGNFESIEAYVKEYIRINILKLYDIDTNEFYVKQDATITSTNLQSGSNPNSINFVFLNDKQRFTQGYEILKSLQINKRDKLILQFSFTKKPGSGLSVSPKIKIKFI
jgi:hypothetical protein